MKKSELKNKLRELDIEFDKKDSVKVLKQKLNDYEEKESELKKEKQMEEDKLLLEKYKDLVYVEPKESLLNQLSYLKRRIPLEKNLLFKVGYIKEMERVQKKLLENY
jgi:hypothetical protein